MSTLPDLPVEGKSPLGLDHTQANESSDAGLSLVAAFVQKIGLRAQLTQIPMQDTRKYSKMPDADILIQLIFQKLAGYAHDSAANEFSKKMSSHLWGSAILANRQFRDFGPGSPQHHWQRYVK